MISIEIWETPLSWRAKCCLPVAVRVSKTRVLKLPIGGKNNSEKVFWEFDSIIMQNLSYILLLF